METITHFRNITGLKANMDKSSIFMAGVDGITKEQLLENTGFVLGTLSIKYLGLALYPKK